MKTKQLFHAILIYNTLDEILNSETSICKAKKPKIDDIF